MARARSHPTGVLVVESVPIVREGIRSILRASLHVRLDVRRPDVVVLGLPRVFEIRCVHRGSRARLRRDCSAAELVSSIRAVAAGTSSRRRGAFSPREWQVAAHVVDGQTNREIAALLGLSVRTVESHRANLMKKAGLRSAAGLVRFVLMGRRGEGR